MGAFTTWLNGLTSKTTPVAADELYLRDSEDAGASKKLTWANLKAAAGAPGGSTTQVQFNDGGAFSGDAGLTYNKTNKALTVGGATVTTSNPVLNLSQTWNAGGVTFTGIKFDVIRTAAASASMFSDFQQGGISRIQLRMDTSQPTLDFMTDYGRIKGNSAIDLQVSTTLVTRIDPASHQNKSTINVGWCSGIAGFGNDTGLSRNAAGVVEINSGTATNFRDLKLRNLIGTGNLATGIVAKTANYTGTANDGTVEYDATSGALTHTLPAVASTGGRIYVIKKTDSSGNAVTVDANASETIDGATTVSLASQYSTIILQANTAGTAWLKLAGI